MRIYAVIPTHNRHEELAGLLRTIPESVRVLVIDNASTPRIAGAAGLRGELFNQFLGRRVQVTRDEEQPPNLSRLWNIGIDWAANLYRAECKLPVEPGDEWAVAILNDDVLLPPGFLGVMAQSLEDYAVDIAFPGPGSHSSVVNRAKGPVPLAQRMTGWCFVLRGSAGLRADERLRWWCGDNDLEQQALQGGRGTAGVAQRLFNTGHPDTDLRHLHPDESTVGVLREQTNADMATFVGKWGFRPW